MWIPGKSEKMIQEYCNRNRDASLSTAPESSSTFCCPCSTSHLVRKDTIQNNKSDIEIESEIKKHSDLVRKDTIQNNKSKIESESEIKKQSETTTASQGECQCHKRRKTTLPSTEQTHIDERRAAEATSDIHASKIPEQQARVLNAIQILRLELKLKLPAGWDDSALALLVRMYDATCGQRSQMSALHKELGVKTGRHERSIRRFLQNLRKLFGSAQAARLARACKRSAFYSLRPCQRRSSHSTTPSPTCQGCTAAVTRAWTTWGVRKGVCGGE